MTRNYLMEISSLVHQTGFFDLPATTIEKAKLHLLDTLGVGIAGATSDETSKAAVIFGGSKGVSQIWGQHERLGARDAAFLNGVSAHAYELDDTGGCDHSGAVVLPAILALLPLLREPLSGPQLLLSMAMGYEVGRRVLETCGGYEVHNGLGWHSTGTCGVFGAAAGAATVLRLDERRLSSALGIACSFAGGTWAFIHDGSQTKKLHAGRAAEGGAMAALLAAASFDGPIATFQPATWGSYMSAYGRDRGDSEALVAGFGERWRLDRCSIKPYATCRGTHSAIDAVDLLLAQHSLASEAITSVEARMSVFQAGMCGGSSIETRAQAQMSLPYAVAARLTFGKVFLDELEEKALCNQDIARRLAKTVVQVDPNMPDDAEPEITLITETGQRFSAVVESPLGSPTTPLPKERLVDKFQSLAGRVLDPVQVKKLADYVLNIDQESDVRGLPTLLAAA